MDTCIYTTESLCCPPETITTLLIGYTQNKIKSLKKKKGEEKEMTRVKCLAPSSHRTKSDVSPLSPAVHLDAGVLPGNPT